MTIARGFATVLMLTIAVSVIAQEGMARRPRSASCRKPVYFEENADQTGNRLRFIAHGGRYALFLTDSEAVVVLQKQEIRAGKVPAESATVRLKLSGANAHPSVRGEGMLEAKSNYFIGNDPSKWRTNVAQYAKVRFTEVYRGIDVVFYGNDEQFEYDFVVRPGADVRQIRLRYEGAERIEIDPAGELVLDVRGGQLRQRLPVVYQDVGGNRDPVRASYRRVNDREFGVDIAPYDATRPLVIDPVLIYSTYLGGSSDDSASGVAVDSAGNAYVTGSTFSTDFPTTAGALKTTGSSGSIEAFVTKLNPSGSPVYSTYLGGGAGSHTEAYAIAVDSAGSAYITGLTYGDIPIVNAAQPAIGGLNDAFVTKLNASGSAVIYSTYIGGQTSEAGYGIAVNSAGTAVVTGDTDSADFPTVNALQSSLRGTKDAFVAKLNPSGSAFVYDTLLGGNLIERGEGVAVDSAGNAYVTGFTNSVDFPTANAFQPNFGGGEDAFVTKINPSGSALVYSTYFGGSTLDDARGIAVDAAGNAAFAGFTFSADFPTMRAWQPNIHGSADAFVAKLNSSGSALIYSTFLGGTQEEGATGIAADGAGNVYLAGFTTSSDFPTASPVQPVYGGGSTDAFVAALNSTGSTLIYSSYLGGNASDEASGAGVGSSGTAVIVGFTNSPNFPTVNAFQPTLGGSSDAFVAAIGIADLTITKTHLGNFLQGQSGATYTLTVTNSGSGASSGLVTVTDSLPSGLTATNITGGGWTCTLATPPLTCTRNDGLGAGSSYPPITLTVDVAPTTVGTVMNVATVSGGFEANTANDSTTDVTTVDSNPALPMLDPRFLAALALILAAIAVVGLRR